MVSIMKNDRYTLEITGMTHEGQGVGRVDGFTVFVDGALVGESVEIKIVKITKNYAIGKLLTVLVSSSERIQPFCSIFKSCGGCGLQHMSYSEQLKFKTGVVRDSIRRIGKLENVVIHDTIGMTDPFGYRNKAQFPVGFAGGGPIAGFYSSRSHDVIECDECGIQNNASCKLKQIIIDFIREYGISVYDETTGRGLVRHILIRSGFRTGEIMVVMVINGNDLPKKQELVKLLVSGNINDKGRNPDEQHESGKDLRKGNEWVLRSIYININRKETNIIMGDKNIKIFGQDTITDYIGDLKFNISPMSFFQVNPVQTEVLYSKAMEYAGLTGKETVFDLYCGIGTISLFLAKSAKNVIGVEVVEEAIDDAQGNARINGVDNVEFIAGDVEVVVPDLYKKGIRADVVVVDPPRKGCDEGVLKTLVDMQPERIVYVSCNPSTLARDLAFLEGNGFKAVEVQPVDMFPWTHHVECVVLMTKCGLEDK